MLKSLRLVSSRQIWQKIPVDESCDGQFLCQSWNFTHCVVESTCVSILQRHGLHLSWGASIKRPRLGVLLLKGRGEHVEISPDSLRSGVALRFILVATLTVMNMLVRNWVFSWVCIAKSKGDWWDWSEWAAGGYPGGGYQCHRFGWKGPWKTWTMRDAKFGLALQSGLGGATAGDQSAEQIGACHGFGFLVSRFETVFARLLLININSLNIKRQKLFCSGLVKMIWLNGLLDCIHLWSNWNPKLIRTTLTKTNKWQIPNEWQIQNVPKKKTWQKPPKEFVKLIQQPDAARVLQDVGVDVVSWSHRASGMASYPGRDEVVRLEISTTLTSCTTLMCSCFRVRFFVYFFRFSFSSFLLVSPRFSSFFLVFRFPRIVTRFRSVCSTSSRWSFQRSMPNSPSKTSCRCDFACLLIRNGACVFFSS